ncbi:hypothetical protein GOP47_0028997 [Adiantum capillus-veneris]|nr:hypothetical protein GOP47_0028997 [Adiantum capillus-veneris]
MHLEMECWRRFASIFLLVSFEERKQCTFIRKIKVLAMAIAKTVLPFLVCLLFLVCVARMFQRDVTAEIDSSFLALSNSSMHGKTSAKIASLPSLLTSLCTKTSSLIEEWKDRFHYSSSESATPTSSALSESSLTLSVSSYSASSAAAQTLHNESKETMSCPPSCFRPNPVCGTNGVTYWCGSVDAECAGVEVDYEGFCDFDSKGTGVRGVLAIQSLLLVHMVWLMLAAFLVFLGVI